MKFESSIALSGCLLTLVAIILELSKIMGYNVSQPIIIVLALIGLLILLLGLFLWIKEKFKKLSNNNQLILNKMNLLIANFFERSDFFYECNGLQRNELQNLYNFCMTIIPGTFTDISIWYKRYDKNPNIFFKIKKIIRKVNESKIIDIVGGFSILPLNSKGLKKVENGASGMDITERDITLKNWKPKALYIAWIMSEDNDYNKGFTLKAIKTYLQMFYFGKKNIYVYAKPASKRGLSLIKKWGLIPLEGGEVEMGKVCKISVHELMQKCGNTII